MCQMVWVATFWPLSDDDSVSGSGSGSGSDIWGIFLDIGLSW